MPRIEDRVCPACGESCSSLLRACPHCKQPFGAAATADSPPAGAAPVPAPADEPPRARIALQKPKGPVEPTPPSPAASPQAPQAPDTAQAVFDPARASPAPRAQVALVKPKGIDPAPRGASPAPIAQPSNPHTAPMADPHTAPMGDPGKAPSPRTPPAPAGGRTIPMDAGQAAAAMAGSTPGAARSATPKLPGPVATPVPSAPPRSSARRGDGNTWVVAAVVCLIGAGVATAAMWNRHADDDESGASGTTIPLPPPPTTVKADPVPPADSPSTDSPPPGGSDSPPPGGSDSPPPESPTATGSEPPPRQKASADGWIPAEATEATETASLHADPKKDPLCAKTETPVQIGKEITIAFEKGLREATRVTDAEESRIGARLESAIARERSFAGKWDLPADVSRYGKYLSDLVRHLAKGKSRTGIDYRIHIVRKPEFNAGALPGGVLMVNTGALEGDQAVASEAELVAVLGHEISHVEKRHTIAAYQYAKAIFGEDQDAQIAMKVLSTPISSQYELEADDNGFLLGVKAQYNPSAGVDLWRRHAKTERPAPGGILGEVLDSLIRSHPRSAVRACRAMDRVNWAHDNAEWRRLYDGRTNLRTRIMGPLKTY